MSIDALEEPFRFRGENKVAGTYPGVKGDCGTTIAPKASCWVGFAFAPTIEGLNETEIQLNFFDGYTTKVAPLSMTGSGIDPGVLVFVDAAAVDFGAVAIATQVEHLFSLKNTGKSTVSNFIPSALDIPLSYKDGTFPGTDGTCDDSLAPDASCTFIIQFEPTTTELQQVSLTINYSDGATSQSVAIDVSGSGK